MLCLEEYNKGEKSIDRSCTIDTHRSSLHSTRPEILPVCLPPGQTAFVRPACPEGAICFWPLILQPDSAARSLQEP
jgi:hypothetical protein